MSGRIKMILGITLMVIGLTGSLTWREAGMKAFSGTWRSVDSTAGNNPGNDPSNDPFADKGPGGTGPWPGGMMGGGTAGSMMSGMMGSRGMAEMMGGMMGRFPSDSAENPPGDGNLSGGDTGGNSAAKDDAGATPTHDFVVNMQAVRFAPSRLVVPVGSQVLFTNRDPVSHRVVQASPDDLGKGRAGFASPILGMGKSWLYTFDQSGRFPILCDVNSHHRLGMIMEIVVE
ncbi:MAG: hypothetical protein HYY09_00130 [Firmicutes bacterium]|nr:hypothetical protein [Bacillota bacterium]